MEPVETCRRFPGALYLGSGSSSLKVVSELGMKVHFLVETPAALRRVGGRELTHTETTLWARHDAGHFTDAISCIPQSSPGGKGSPTFVLQKSSN